MIGRSISPADTGNFFGTELNVTVADEIQLFSDNVNNEIKKIALFRAHENGIMIKEMILPGHPEIILLFHM
jgi:hypothetical protein